MFRDFGTLYMRSSPVLSFAWLGFDPQLPNDLIQLDVVDCRCGLRVKVGVEVARSVRAATRCSRRLVTFFVRPDGVDGG